jgi:hypothetical protein
VSIAERLAAAVADSRVITLDMLGTPSELNAEASALATGSQASFVASAFLSEIEGGTWTDTYRTALHRFVAGLSQQKS